jgi:uncharacterized repeat protein (TIGR01451 family)
MNRQLTSKLKTMAIAAALILSTFQMASATGTAAKTEVDNLATLTYDVGPSTYTLESKDGAGNTTLGVGQGVSTKFEVDLVVLFTITSQSGDVVNVSPGQVDAVITFRVENLGNGWLDFDLAAIQGYMPGGGDTTTADEFDATGAAIYVDTDDDDTYTPGGGGTDDDLYINELAQDTHIEVFYVGNIPSALFDGDDSYVMLQATALLGDTAQTGATGSGKGGAITDDADNAWTQGTMQHVFADVDDTVDGPVTGFDVDNDGIYTDRSAFNVQAPVLTMIKSLTVADVAAYTAIDKAIPGSTVTYTISIENTGSVAATDVDITDVLADEGVAISFVVGTHNGGTCPADPCGILYTNTVGAVSQELTNASVADEFGVIEGEFSTPNVVVTDFTIDAGATATISYAVLIN